VRLKALPILFHLTPLIPLWLGWPYITIAGIILVAVPYIKVRKLTAQLTDLLEHPQSNISAKDRDERRDIFLAKEKASLEKTIRLWDSLTLF
jgi:hypothetical protein